MKEEPKRLIKHFINDRIVNSYNKATAFLQRLHAN